jgi:hypothetical protein
MDKFRDGAVNDVLRRVNAGEDLKEILARFDDETLEYIYTPEVRREFENLITFQHKFNAPQIQNIMADEYVNAALIKDLLNADSTKVMRNLYLASMNDPKMMHSFRTGIIDNIVDAATVNGKKIGERYLNPDIMDREIKKYTENQGTRMFMTDYDIEQLHGLRDYLRMSSYGMDDSGASLVAAELPAQIIRFNSGSISALIQLGKYKLIGQHMVNGKLEKYMHGEGAKRKGTDYTHRIAGSALLSWVDQLLDDADQDSGPMVAKKPDLFGSPLMGED